MKVERKQEIARLSSRLTAHFCKSVEVSRRNGAYAVDMADGYTLAIGMTAKEVELYLRGMVQTINVMEALKPLPVIQMTPLNGLEHAIPCAPLRTTGINECVPVTCGVEGPTDLNKSNPLEFGGFKVVEDSSVPVGQVRIVHTSELPEVKTPLPALEALLDELDQAIEDPNYRINKSAILKAGGVESSHEDLTARNLP